MQLDHLATRWEIPPDKQTNCQLHVERYSDGDRLWRAAKFAVPLFLLGCATILIPIVHFFAPPILMIFAVVIGVRNLNLREAIVQASGPCPACGEPIDIPIGGVKPVYPIWGSTPCACRERVRILAPSPTA